MKTIRVASYNIRKAIGTDRRRMPERVLEVLGEVDADIIALQEADRRFGVRSAAIPPVLMERWLQSQQLDAERTDAASPWQTPGWMPVGRRRRRFVFRQGQSEHAVTLIYGNGPAQVRIADKDFAFEAAPDHAGGLSLALDGMRSHVACVVEGHELYLRTRNGRFELHWVDPFGGDDE